MKPNLKTLPLRYGTALRKHLKTGSSANPLTALRLGREALLLKLETLDLARIHDLAVATLEAPTGKRELNKQAEIFFTEAIAPIVETHRAAREGKVQLKQAHDTLTQRTRELATAHRQLRSGIARRKGVEVDLKKCGEHYTKLLKQSLHLQDGLRQLTRKLLGAQESERKQYSGRLANDIAQTLVGVNVRLLTMKKESAVNTLGLQNEIIKTGQMVSKSARSVRRVARKFANT